MTTLKTSTTATVKPVAKKPTAKKIAPRGLTSVTTPIDEAGTAKVVAAPQDAAVVVKKVAAKPVAKKAKATVVAKAAPAVKPVVAKKPLDPKVKQKRDLMKKVRALIAEAAAGGWVLAVPLEAGKPVPKLYETAVK